MSGRYGSLNRRVARQQSLQHPARLANGSLAGYPSSDEELRSPHRRRRLLLHHPHHPLGARDELAGPLLGHHQPGCLRTCSDSLVTALEDEASASSLVADYIVADDNMSALKADGLQSASAAGSFTVPGGRVHFSSGAAGPADDVSLYGTPKEEAGPGPGPAGLGGEPKPSFIRNQLQALFQPTDNKLAMKLFGSKKALMKERIRQKAAGHWIIHPCSNFRYARTSPETAARRPLRNATPARTGRASK